MLGSDSGVVICAVDDSEGFPAAAVLPSRSILSGVEDESSRAVLPDFYIHFQWPHSQLEISYTYSASHKQSQLDYSTRTWCEPRGNKKKGLVAQSQTGLAVPFGGLCILVGMSDLSPGPADPNAGVQHLDSLRQCATVIGAVNDQTRLHHHGPAPAQTSNSPQPVQAESTRASETKRW
jgi:hypothetical protein